jgi:hypothetical protein
MKRMLWLLVILPFLPGTAFAQSVRGTVLDDGTREPIAGAVVELHASDARRTMAAR